MMVVKRPLVPAITCLLSASRDVWRPAYRGGRDMRLRRDSEAFGMAGDEALGAAQDGPPARALGAGRIARGARVEAHPGDDRERMARVRVDRDPGTFAGAAPLHEAAGVERVVE